jgi:putative flippase GtrA
MGDSGEDNLSPSEEMYLDTQELRESGLADESIISTVWHKYSIFRYAIIGSINMILFFGLYIILQWIFGSISHGKTVAWAVSWAVEATLAHFLHRTWTFKSESVVAKSLTITTLIYTITLFTSSVTFDLLVYRQGIDHNVAWWLSALAWGGLNYMAISRYAFPKQTRVKKEAN